MDTVVVVVAAIAECLYAAFSSEDRDQLCALVPHVGAHLSELTQISDGNSDYLSDCPHLHSLEKLHLLAGTVSALSKLQRMRYNLTPLRAVAAAINLAVKKHLRLSTLAGDELRNRLFALSLAQESPRLVAQHNARKKGADSGDQSAAGRTFSGESSATTLSDPRPTSTSSSAMPKFGIFATAAFPTSE